MALNDKSSKLGLLIGVRPKTSPPSSPFGGGPKAPPPEVDDSEAEGSEGGDPVSPGGSTAKVSRDEAGYTPQEACCGACTMFHCESGDCDAVEGKFRAGDYCEKYFQPCNPAYLTVRPTPPHNEAAEEEPQEAPEPQGDGADRDYAPPSQGDSYGQN